MADKLAQFLRAGETVVYRPPRDRLDPHWRWNLVPAGLLCLILFGLVVGLNLDSPEIWFIASGLAAFIILLFVRADGIEGMADTAVTSRRLLRVGARGGQLDYREVGLEEVAAVTIRCDAVEVTRTDGVAVAFQHPTRATEMGRALARAVGLPEPAPPRERVHVLNSWGHMFKVFALGAAAVAANHVIEAVWPDMGWPGFLLAVGVLALIWCALWLLLLVPLGALLLRPALTRQELRDLVSPAATSRSGVRSAGSGIMQRFHLRVIDQLYAARPPRAEPEGNGNG